MKQFVKKSCFTLELRIGFLIVCIVSLVLFGLTGAALPSIMDMILRRLMRDALTNPSAMDILTPLTLMVDTMYTLSRVLGFATFVSSVLLLVSWFLMNKYSGTGPDAGMFSCFAAVNPMNISKRKNLKWWMLPWLVCSGFFFLGLVYLGFDVILKSAKYGVGVVAFIVPPIAIIIIGLLQLYCVAVVVSYYLEQTNSSI